MTSLVTAKYDSNKNQILDPNTNTGFAQLATDPLTGKTAGIVDPAGGVAFSNPVRRFRDSISAALVKNALANQPLIAPAAWVISTAYVPGQAVTNGGNVYICITGGTSAGAGGPTTTVAGTITDNTVAWFYAGPSFSSASNAPTSLAVTTTAYTGTYYRTTTGTYPIGSSQVSDSSNFFVSGGKVTETGQNNGFGMVAQTAPAPNGALMLVQFMCDAKQLQIHIAQTISPGVTIYVDQNDGAGLVPLTLGISGVNASSQNYYQIVWPTAKPRMYAVEVSSLPAVYGFLGVVLNENASKVWAPTNPNRYRMMLVGDSWFIAATTYPVSNSLLISSQIAKLIGCTDFVIDGEGGSGYVAAGTGSVFGSPQRLALLAAMAPDVVLIEGGTNDAGAALAVEQAAVLAYLQSIRALLPNAVIIVSGCNTNNSGPSANAFTIELAISNAVTAFNDPRTFFYPFSATTAAKAWLSGTGTTAATTGTGNCDLYIAGDAHPTYQGAAYVAYRTANAIRSIANGSWT